MLAWEKVMEKIHQPIFDACAENNEETKGFDYSNMYSQYFCTNSGELAGENCKIAGNASYGYYYDYNHLPDEVCDMCVAE